MTLRTFSVTLTALATLACSDPTHDAAVAMLGPEATGVDPGPLHRPGQPCLVCHGGEGPASATFVTAGTVYVNPYTAGTTVYAPQFPGSVHLVDATGSAFSASTNEVGNFYVAPDEWSPMFPLGGLSQDSGIPASGCISALSGATAYAGEIGVAGTADGGCAPVPTPMTTTIDRGGAFASCAYCHFDPPGPSSPGHVYVQ